MIKWKTDKSKCNVNMNLFLLHVDTIHKTKIEKQRKKHNKISTLKRDWIKKKHLMTKNKISCFPNINAIKTKFSIKWKIHCKIIVSGTLQILIHVQFLCC